MLSIKFFQELTWGPADYKCYTLNECFPKGAKAAVSELSESQQINKTYTKVKKERLFLISLTNLMHPNSKMSLQSYIYILDYSRVWLYGYFIILTKGSVAGKIEVNFIYEYNFIVVGVINVLSLRLTESLELF